MIDLSKNWGFKVFGFFLIKEEVLFVLDEK